MMAGKRKRILHTRLLKARKIAGYTHADVMEILGMRSNNRLSQWEKGVRAPGLKNALKLSILYKILIDQIFFDLREEAFKEVTAGLQRLEAKRLKENRKKPP